MPVSSLLICQIVLKKNWTKLFRPLHLKDLSTIIIFLFLSLLSSFVLYFIVNQIVPLNENPNIADNTTPIVYIGSLICRIFSLFGEELSVILPFLACLQIFYQRNPTKRKQAIWYSLIISSIIFGLIHLPVYNWNVVQCIIIIGLGRIVDTLAYIKTKNLLVTYLVHFFYDTLLASLVFIS